jgi:hypothetical protein
MGHPGSGGTPNDVFTPEGSMHVEGGQLRFAESHSWRKTRAQIWATRDLAARTNSSRLLLAGRLKLPVTAFLERQVNILFAHETVLVVCPI